MQKLNSFGRGKKSLAEIVTYKLLARSPSITVPFCFPTEITFMSYIVGLVTECSVIWNGPNRAHPARVQLCVDPAFSNVICLL